jgi:hypothetical protein
LYLCQGKLYIRRRIKVTNILGNSIREGEVMFMKGVWRELDGPILGDIQRVRPGKGVVL